MSDKSKRMAQYARIAAKTKLYTPPEPPKCPCGEPAAFGDYDRGKVDLYCEKCAEGKLPRAIWAK